MFTEKKAREVDMGDIVWPPGIRPGRVRMIGHSHIGTQTTLVSFDSVDDGGGTYTHDYLPDVTVRLWNGSYQEATAAWVKMFEKTEPLAQQILAIIARAMQDVDKVTESKWAGILGVALDDIETLCNAQKKED